MKAIVLAGGNGERLAPYTSSKSKHLLKVANSEIIIHSIAVLEKFNVDEIILITKSRDVIAYQNILENKFSWIKEISYVIQDEPLGVSHAIYLARDYVKSQSFFVLLGDNVFLNFEPLDISKITPPHVFCKHVNDARPFGLAEIQQNKIVSVIEKDENARSGMILTGLYFYNESFFNVFNKNKMSNRNEYEISDVNNYYAVNGGLSYTLLCNKTKWFDCGTLESIRCFEEVLLKKSCV